MICWFSAAFAAALLVACNEGKDIDGWYRSTWGPTQFATAEGRVLARYPRGSLDCARTGNELSCSWTDGASHGKARLTREVDGTLRGTWGRDESDSDGGTWVFTR